ncbi:MAG: phytanoyl-CoA dioxygenase family protein [Lentisphaeria bacterium]|nr:phytanoyl-CoA dioxygenase family protein [Lentisphaeria bacterium]
MKELTDDHLAELIENGFVIVEKFFDEEDCKRGVEEMHKVLKPWSEVKDDPPENLCTFTTWPGPSLWINRFAITNDTFVAFAKKYLQTEHIHLRSGTPFVRYPGCTHFTGDGSIHIDNINNSLLPECNDHIFGQIGFWSHLEDVGLDNAPLHLWPHSEKNRTLENATKLNVPAGSIGIFTNYTWHSASVFTGTDGQRYIWGGSFGRADHVWEGFKHYTDLGNVPTFIELVCSLTPTQREMLRFPAPGHRYYTKESLVKLEERYPGFDESGEYAKNIQ